MIVGLGAVSTTFIAGVMLARKGLGKPVGALTCYDKIRVGEGLEKKYLGYREIVPLADLNDIIFGAWDIFSENAFEAALNADVLKKEDLLPVKEELENIQPMTAAFDRKFVKRIYGDNIKNCKDRLAMVEEIREDIRRFKSRERVERIVVLWAASTEIYVEYNEDVHGSLQSFEKALKANEELTISPSMCYAYAALSEGCPFIMGAPNTTVDFPAMWEFAEKQNVAIAGKDFKTGQTLIKTGFAPIISTKCLGLSGWFSTNILGNRDGLVLDEPENFRSKEISKSSVLEGIISSEERPDLYSEYCHKVRINYYPPRKDNKESWDNIDIFGWLDYPMQIKINFLCRDSILAAPVCLDLVVLIDLAQRMGRYGIQRFLSFFFKSPMVVFTEKEKSENNLFKQYIELKNAIREMGGYKADELCD